MLITAQEARVAQDFYPFVDNDQVGGAAPMQVRHPARIAVYDDPSAAPRVVIVEPKDVRAYLEEITLQVSQLSASQGGGIPFMVIREIVENFIHAYFMEPTISILDRGNTIRFSDQGPGISQKELALQYGTTSATEEMRHYIRGVGSGLPYVHQYMVDKGGSLKIEDNISGGTVVTISTSPAAPQPAPYQAPMQAMYQQQYGQWPQQSAVPMGAQSWPSAAPQGWPNMAQPQPTYPAAPTQYPPQPMGVGANAPMMGMQAPPAQPIGLQPEQPSPWPALSVRARAVMDYLKVHDSVGPSDLARQYGESQPTWTRELQSLEEAGLIRKDGQKRRLTAMGQAFLA
jgi:DNA-binding transcriptional ArsR family regulator